MSVTTSQKAVAEVTATKAWAIGRMIYLSLSDGRQVGFPASRFRLLRDAATLALREVKIRSRGRALRWENLDEDILVEDVANGRFQLPL